MPARATAGPTAARRRLHGVALALTSAACFGVMPVLTKVVYDDGAEPVAVLAVRFAIAAALLLVLARWTAQPLPSGRPLVALALLGGVGYVGQSLCYFFALERIPAGLTALLLYFFPALVVVLSAVLLHERPRPVAIACVVVATAGTALTVGPVGAGRASGIALGLAAALVYALYIVGSSRVRGVGSSAMAATLLSSAAVVTAALAAVTGPALPSTPVAWLALVGVAVVGTAVAVTTFFAALALLGPADTAVVSTAEPVVAVAVAALVLGERLSPLQIAGGVVVLLAVAVLARAGTPAPVAEQTGLPA